MKKIKNLSPEADQGGSARTGVADSVKNALRIVAEQFTGNESYHTDPNLPYKSLSDLMLEYKDSALQSGDVVGIEGDIQIDNISARDCTFEPMLMQRLFQVHAPYKLDVTPRTFSFDSNGISVFGVNNAQVVELASIALATPGLVGWALRIKATDTQSGNASLTLSKAATNFNVSISMTDINTQGILVAINHDQDDLKQVDLTVGAFAGVTQTLDYNEIITDVANQLFFSYSETNPWTIEASNCVVQAYPIIVSRVVNAMIYACVFNEEMKRLPKLLAQSYAM